MLQMSVAVDVTGLRTGFGWGLGGRIIAVIIKTTINTPERNNNNRRRPPGLVVAVPEDIRVEVECSCTANIQGTFSFLPRAEVEKERGQIAGLRLERLVSSMQ